MIELKGIFPPIPTSFDDRQELALDKIRSNLERWNAFELSGYLVLGSNGEMVMLSNDEKCQVFEVAREAIPSDRLMLAGTGAQSTRETMALSRAAADAGADAVLVLNPSYYKGQMTREALVVHYHKVADESPVPMLIYNMPACSGLDMDAATIVEIAQHENIIGVKDSGENTDKLAEVVRTAPPDFQFLVGAAGVLLLALEAGAVGGILALANIAPAQCIDIYESYRVGDLDRARALQQKMVPVNTAVTSVGGVPALKTALDHLGLYGGPCRAPLLPLDDDRRRELFTLLDANGLRL